MQEQENAWTWKMKDQIAGLENTTPNHFASSDISIISYNNNVIPNSVE